MQVIAPHKKINLYFRKIKKKVKSPVTANFQHQSTFAPATNCVQFSLEALKWRENDTFLRTFLLLLRTSFRAVHFGELSYSAQIPGTF